MDRDTRTPVCSIPSPLTFAATSAAVCQWCAGRGYEPSDDNLSVVKCGLCDGGGYASVCGTLAPTKTYPHGRPFRFNPGTGSLEVIRKKKMETYTVCEFAPDQVPGDLPARAFEFVKQSTGERYHLIANRAFIACDCAAKTYKSSARANWRAREAGEMTCDTAGCVHADFVKLALSEGWLA